MTDAARGRPALAAIVLASTASLLCAMSLRGQGALPTERVKLPPGFEIRVWA